MREIIVKYNPWWDKKPIETSKLGMKRHSLKQILKFMDQREIIKLVGIRRSGKTTIMYQLIDHLLRKQTHPKKICYIQMDDEELTLYDQNTLIKQVINEYQEITSNNIETEKIYFFLDEIQYIPKWESWLKTYYDKYKLKFIVSGSSSLLLHKDAVDKLTGRQISFAVTPFSFREYLEFNRIRTKRLELTRFPTEPGTDLLSKKNRIVIALSNYIKTGGFPEILAREEEERNLFLRQYFRDILYRDIIRIFNIRDARALEELSIYLLKHIGERFNFSSLANLLKIHPNTVIEYTNLLKKTFLLDFVTYYSTALKSTIRKDRKPYSIDIGLRNALITEKDEGMCVENLVFNHLRRNYEHIHYWGNRHELDFVVKTYETIIPVEVKYRKDPSEIYGLIEFMNKFNIKTGFVVTKDLLKNETIKEKEIIYVPLWVFLLAF